MPNQPDHDAIDINEHDSPGLNDFLDAINQFVLDYKSGRVNNVLVVKLISAGFKYLHGTDDIFTLVNSTVIEHAKFVASGRADDGPWLNAAARLSAYASSHGL